MSQKFSVHNTKKKYYISLYEIILLYIIFHILYVYLFFSFLNLQRVTLESLMENKLQITKSFLKTVKRFLLKKLNTQIEFI